MDVHASTNASRGRTFGGGLLLRFGLSLGVLVALFLGLHAPASPLTAPQDDGVHFMGPKAAFASAAADGKKIYLTRCMSCHQTNGEGVPGVFPPLVKSEWVTGDAGSLVRIVLHGMTGEVEVNEVVYNSVMPAWGTFLNDEEVAALLTYIRASWGNKAPAVATDEVAKVRAATKSRNLPWTADELKKPANQGIPGAKS